MPSHTIEVSFVSQLVHAEPNPLPAPGGTPPVVLAGDTVEWVFNPTVGQRILDVVFSAVDDLDPTTGKPVGNLQATGALGPFVSLSRNGNRISGTIGSGIPENVRQAKRFFYKLVEDGKPLNWDNSVQGAAPLPGGVLINGGGIDIPRTPP